MKMIVGLGNPGKSYQETYHNIGFLTVDALNASLGGNWKKKGNSLISNVFFEGEKVLLVKPQTYMNLSGEAVVGVKNKFKLSNADILIILDDIDLPVGTIRFRQSGSAGTHNGLKNILQLAKTNQIPRLRIGVGNNPNMDLADFVVSKISRQDMPILQDAILNAADFVLHQFLNKQA